MTETKSVTLDRDYPHPPEKVWRALTEPHLIADWLMSNDFQAKLGHRFKLTADWGAVDCEVTEIDPPSTLAYSWSAMGVDTVVTWTLTRAGEGTRLRMTQSGFRLDQGRAYGGARIGWTNFLDALDLTLTKQV